MDRTWIVDFKHGCKSTENALRLKKIREKLLKKFFCNQAIEVDGDSEQLLYPD